MTDIEIRPSRYLAPTVVSLVAEAMADLGARYGGGGDETPIEAIEFDPPDGAFMVAWRAGQAVGCAGWRSHDESEDVAELKRLYVSPDARGLGVATMLLNAVEDSAADHGRVRMVLECGNKQPEAIALYRKNGYAPIPHFGFYRDAPDVISLGRDLERRG